MGSEEITQLKLLLKIESIVQSGQVSHGSVYLNLEYLQS